MQVVKQAKIGAMPHGGDLLRALRMRRGWSQEETARRVEVTVRTLRRWEKSEVWPSPTQVHTLCYTLQACEEEMLALTMGHLSPQPAAEAPSLEELEERGRLLHLLDAHGPEAEALKELHFLTLEAQAWPMAARCGTGRQVLAEIYSYHAYHLNYCGRFTESALYADRVLELLPQEVGSPHASQSRVLAGITLAHAAVHRGKQPAPQRGVERWMDAARWPAPQRGVEALRRWMNAAKWPEYHAWLLSDMAAYITQDGDVESGLQLAKRAGEIAARSDNPLERYNRELDEAQLLLWAGRPSQALRLIQRDRPHPSAAHSAKFQLLEVEACLGLEEPSLAHSRLQDALQLIETEALVHLSPQAQELALRF